MTQADERIEMEIAASSRRELVAKLCLALNDAFSHRDQWEEGCEIHHWQVTASDFNALPAQIIHTVFNEWSDADERLDEVEFSGYLDTEDGHRAWGFLALRGGQVRVQGRPHLERLHVEEADDRYALTATLRRTSPQERLTTNE